MTYCVGLRLDRGIIFASDTRTNAGFDNVATFSKMHVWERKGDRVLVMLSAGNLAFTQSVISLLNEKIDLGPDEHSLANVATMFQAARLVGETVRELRRNEKEVIDENPTLFSASFILGGQIAGDPPRLFQIYQEGNFIEATKDTAYFQIGEHKYGKPILDRVAKPDMRMGVAAKLILISFEFDAALEPLRRHADRPSDLPQGRAEDRRATADRRRRSLFQKTLGGVVAGDPRRLCAYRRIRRWRRANRYFNDDRLTRLRGAVAGTGRASHRRVDQRRRFISARRRPV